MKWFKRKTKHSIIMRDVKNFFSIKPKDVKSNMYNCSNFVVLKDDSDREYNFIDLEVFPNLKEIMICDFDVFDLYKDIIERCPKLKSIIFVNCRLNYKSKRKVIRQKIDNLSLFYAKVSKIRFRYSRSIKIIKFIKFNNSFNGARTRLTKIIGIEELRVNKEKKERLNYLQNISRIKMMNAFNKNDDKR